MKLSKEERDIIHEAEQEAEHDELFSHDRHKKYFLHFLAIIVLIITVAYFTLSMPTFQNFLGIIESQNTDDNIFVHKNMTIIFPQNILEFLQENYDRQAEHETIYPITHYQPFCVCCRHCAGQTHQWQGTGFYTQEP